MTDGGAVAEKAGSGYRALWSVPGVVTLALVSVIAKLPSAMSTVSLLFAVSWHRPYEVAGLVVALNAVAWAVSAPVRGRLLDRRPRRTVLGWSLLCYLVMVGALVASEACRGPLALTLVSGFLASSCSPQVGLLVRTTWRAAVPPHARSSALAVDAVLTDLVYVVGPVLAALLCAWVPVAGMLTSLALTAAAASWLMRAGDPAAVGPAVVGPAAAGPAPGGGRLGPVANPALRRILVVAALFFAGLTMVEVALPAYAAGRDAARLAGLMLGSLSAGSILGGILMGALPDRWNRARRTPALTQVTFAVSLLVLALGMPAGPGWALALVPVAGLAIGPTFITIYGRAADCTGAAAAAETQAWIGTAMQLGAAAGAGLGGVVSGRGDPARAVLVAAALAGLAALAARRIAGGGGTP